MIFITTFWYEIWKTLFWDPQISGVGPLLQEITFCMILLTVENYSLISFFIFGS